MSLLRPQLERIVASTTTLGDGMQIRRALPTKARRMVGPWCFLDYFGPEDVRQGPGMRVGPHPHIGLQTVTWVLSGEILHRDSLGSIKTIAPGQLNIMTSGRGISHSEESPAPDKRSGELHGLQFWIALPESQRHREPAFDHHPELPRVVHQGLHCIVLVGTALGASSPARVYSPAVAIDIRVDSAIAASLPLEPAFEHAVLVVEGEIEIEGESLTPGTLLYLGGARDSEQLRSRGPARLALVGGEPFGEDLLMWWNFVARSRAELTQASTDWNAAAGYFGEVHGYDGARLTAPMPPW